MIEINVTLCADYHEVNHRHMDQKARMKYRKDCDEVFPGIIVGNGECIKDVRLIVLSHLDFDVVVDCHNLHHCLQ